MTPGDTDGRLPPLELTVYREEEQEELTDRPAPRRDAGCGGSRAKLGVPCQLQAPRIGNYEAITCLVGV